MSLCVIDQNNKTISFAGAQNSIYLIKDEKAHEVKADNYSIGGSFFMDEAMATFNTKKFKYQHGTYLYMFTDGYVDQFGGSENKKLNKSRFKDMLLEMSKSGLHQAKNSIDSYFHNWKGENQQIDDVLVIGARL